MEREPERNLCARHTQLEYHARHRLLYKKEPMRAVGAIDEWDNEYPSGGNYWNSRVDLSWGTYQNKTGSNGISDTPRIIDGSNQDNYPLMSSYEYWSNPISGDINKDMIVDSRDLSQIATAYGSTPEKPNWNPNSDINSNNIVGVLDLFHLGRNFGETSDTGDV